MWGWLSLSSSGTGPRNSIVQENGSDSSPTNGKQETWQAVFAALTDRDLLIYDTVPWSLDGWTKPKARVPLIMTRYQLSRSHQAQVSMRLLLCRLVTSQKEVPDEDYSTFCIRTGTSKGVVNRVFRAECERDLASWARGLVNGTHKCVAAVREVAWGNENARR